jgi:hypothetical protein
MQVIWLKSVKKYSYFSGGCILHSAPFSGLKLFLPESQSVQSTEASGFASNIVLAKYQDRQTCRINNTAYLD